MNNNRFSSIFWDFGGVITSSPFEAFNVFEKENNIPFDFIRKVNSTNPFNNAWAQLEQSKISLEEFKAMSVRITGIKIGKFSILITALSIPVLNIVVGTALIARVLYSLISDGPIAPIVKVPEYLPEEIYKKSL